MLGDDERAVGELGAGDEAELEVALEPGVRCTLRISDGRTGEPVSEAFFCVLEANYEVGRILARADENGRIELEFDGPPPVIALGAPGYNLAKMNPRLLASGWERWSLTPSGARR